MMIKRLTLHQTSHVLNSPNRKCFAEFQFLCKSNHRLHYSVASIDVWSQWRSDNLDQWKNYLLFSSSFGEQDIYECRRSYGRICASFHYPWYIMCCLLWKTWSTGTRFCGCVGFICGKFSFILFYFRFNFIYWLIFLQPISPQMIILRVAMGRAWTKETPTKLGVASSGMEFAERGIADTEGSYIYGRSGSKNTLSEKSDGAV